MAVLITEASSMPFYGEKPNLVYRFMVSADTVEELKQFIADKGEFHRLDAETGRTMLFTKFPKFRQGRIVRTAKGTWVMDTSEIEVLNGQLENATGVLADKLAEKLVRLTTEIHSPEGRVKFVDEQPATPEANAESDELGEL